MTDAVYGVAVYGVSTYGTAVVLATVPPLLPEVRVLAGAGAGSTRSSLAAFGMLMAVSGGTPYQRAGVAGSSPVLAGSASVS